jgi:hypothetical protein
VAYLVMLEFVSASMEFGLVVFQLTERGQFRLEFISLSYALAIVTRPRMRLPGAGFHSKRRLRTSRIFREAELR